MIITRVASKPTPAPSRGANPIRVRSREFLAAILLIAKCLVSGSFDRWFAAGFAAFAVANVAISLGAKTRVWDHFAAFLLR